VDLAAAPVFTPMTVRPEIRNRNAVMTAMERAYPPILRDAGIGGQVVVWFFISEDGQVLDKRVSQSSGHTQLDNAALEVADVYRFTPALNRDQKVKVWIQIPITFQVR
jgi:protein TonB